MGAKAFQALLFHFSGRLRCALRVEMLVETMERNVHIRACSITVVCVCVCLCVGAGFYLAKSSMSAGISCYLCHQSASIIRQTFDVQSIMWQRSVLTDSHIGAIIRSNQIKGELCIRVRKFHFLLL